MTIRFATPDEIANWDTRLLANPDGGNVFQMKESAVVKEPTGWRPRYLVADSVSVLALERHIPGLGAFWYLPKGPSVTSERILAALVPDLRSFAAAASVFAVKIEPEFPSNEASRKALIDSGLHPSFPVQPNQSTVLIDLTPPLEDVLMAFNQKGRHAVRRAERDGVTAGPVELTQENIDIMYELMRQTAEGQWSLRPKAYLERYWKTFVASGHGQMFFATYQGKVVAASFGIALGKNGTYKDGASIRKRTAYGASHLLQWEMMTWMKSRGVNRYDLCGTPPADRIDDPTHPLHGVGRFKTSFNKSVTEYVGAYELPVHPFRFKLWKLIIERLVLRWHRACHHQEWY